MGSSGGGGGSSGAVSHSAYLEAVHSNWLNATGVDTIEKSITEVMDSALGSSPFTGALAYDPDTDIADMEAAIAAFSAILAGLSETTDWNTMYANADATFGSLGSAVTAYGDLLDDNINAVVLPRFRRGMQDINAVVSSAFVIGESIIEGFRDRDVAKYIADLESKKIEAVNQMMDLWSKRIGWQESQVKVIIESNRIKIVAKKEETDQNISLDEQDAKWDLEVFQYGANMLAASSGGVATPAMKGVNKTSSAIGGAMSGAASGAMLGMAMGPAAPLSIPMMALAGGILGGGAGFL